MRTPLALSLLVLGIGACRRPDSSAQTTVDTAIVFVAEPSATGRGPTLRIVVTRDASVYADGRPVPVARLDATLSALRLKNGAVSYYRAAPDRRTTWQQDSVIKAIAVGVATNRLPITFLSRTDAAIFTAEFERSLHSTKP
jgi:hypothetical protein